MAPSSSSARSARSTSPSARTRCTSPSTVCGTREELASNDSASLLDLGDGVLCLEFHSKGNSIDAQIVEMGNRGIDELERDDVVGLVVGNEGRNFSVGANLGEMAHAVQNEDLDQIEERASRPCRTS